MNPLQRAGLSRTFASMILHGHSKDPGAHKLARLARVLGCSVDDLLAGRGPGDGVEIAPGAARGPAAAGSDVAALGEADLSETDLRLARLLHPAGGAETYEVRTPAVICAGIAPGARILVAAPGPAAPGHNARPGHPRGHSTAARG